MGDWRELVCYWPPAPATALITGPLLVGVSHTFSLSQVHFSQVFFARKSPVKYEWDDKSLGASLQTGAGEGDDRKELFPR